MQPTDGAKANPSVEVVTPLKSHALKKLASEVVVASVMVSVHAPVEVTAPTLIVS